MKLFFLLFPVLALAQTSQNFHEISPEREKKLQELAEQRRLKVLAKKRQDEERKRDALEREQQIRKKAETETYTKWLISERDRKMKEAFSLPATSPTPEIKRQNSGAFGLRKSACTFGKVKFPPNTKVIGIGTYEGTYPEEGGRGFRHHPMTNVQVNVQSTDPIIIVANTYEPIHWEISSKGKILGVMVMGYHEQEVSVEGDVPIIVSSFEGKQLCGQYRGSPGNISHDVFSKIVLSERARDLTGLELSEYVYQYRLPPEIKVGSN